MKNILTLAISLILLSCNKMDGITTDVCPSCFKAIMESSNPPLEVWRYNYNNQIVYLAKADCCDQYDQVYSADCVNICAPSGGITGKGDGKCPDFNEKATDGKLIWKAE